MEITVTHEPPRGDRWSWRCDQCREGWSATAQDVGKAEAVAWIEAAIRKHMATWHKGAGTVTVTVLP